MKSTVILKKKKPVDTFGYLSIRYFNGSGERKVLSLGEVVKESDFKKYYNKEFKQFKPNSSLANLNKKISDKIDDYSIFDKPKKSTKIVVKIVTDSFITYYKKHISLITNPATKKGNISALNKLVQFQLFKKNDDIPFVDITRDWVKEFKNYLLQTLQSNTLMLSNQY